MKTAIILHGMTDRHDYDANPMQAQQHWIPWLEEQLEAKGIAVDALELPKPYEPIYEEWKQVFEQFHIDSETVLIGHSGGAGFLVRWLSENTIKAGKLILVAPWMDPNHTLPSGFFDCSIDPSIAERADGIHIFISQDDEQEMHTTVKNIQAAIPNLVLHTFSDRGHFTKEDMETTAFPELLEAIL